MGNKPFLLKPIGKDYLWGGNRLNDEFEKHIDMAPLAETWECSTHPDGESFIESGEFRGKLLTDVLKMHPEFICEKYAYAGNPYGEGQLPILIKFIDASKDLSVQVHPDDTYARNKESGQRGKAEMWYVLDTAPDARIIYGFRESITKNEIRETIRKGTLLKYLNRVKIKKDDIYFIEPGVVHAIGAGSLVAEIQENSNLTYRLFDYDRIDSNGKKRELHIDKALDIAKSDAVAEPRQPLRVLKYRKGMASEFLCRCQYFEVYRLIIDTQRRQQVMIRSDEMGFRVLLCVKGCGTIYYDEDCLDFYKGDCIFVPAGSVEIRFHGVAQFLDVWGQ